MLRPRVPPAASSTGWPAVVGVKGLAKGFKGKAPLFRPPAAPALPNPSAGEADYGSPSAPSVMNSMPKSVGALGKAGMGLGGPKPAGLVTGGMGGPKPAGKQGPDPDAAGKGKFGNLFGKAMSGLEKGKGKGMPSVPGKGSTDNGVLNVANAAMTAILPFPPAAVKSQDDNWNWQNDDSQQSGGGQSTKGGSGGSGNECFRCGGPHLKRDCPESDKGKGDKGDKGKGKDKGSKGKGKDDGCFRCGGAHQMRDCKEPDKRACHNCGGAHIARDCPEPKGKGKGEGSREDGKLREPEHPFDLMETIEDLTTLPYLDTRGTIMLGRALELRFSNHFFEEWLNRFPDTSEGSARGQLDSALDDNLWGFTRPQRVNLLEVLAGHGFEYPEWKEKSDSVVVVGRARKGKGKRKRDGDGDGKGGGKKKGKRGRRGDKVLDPDDPMNTWKEGKTGANTIEVNWKPPKGDDDDDDDDDEGDDDEEEEWGDEDWNEGDEEEEKPKPAKKAKKEKKAPPPPVRGPAGRGRGSALPAWMTEGIGNTSAPEPEKKAPSGPAGRGRGTTLPSWMTQGVSDEVKPSIPDPDAEEEPVEIAPNILDSIFEERDVGVTDGYRGRSRSRGRRGKGKGKDRKGKDRGKGKKGKQDDDEDQEEAQQPTPPSHPPSKGIKGGSLSRMQVPILPLGKGAPPAKGGSILPSGKGGKGSPRPPFNPPPGMRPNEASPSILVASHVPKGGIRPVGSVGAFLNRPKMMPAQERKRGIDACDL